jgi:hypothetical protein
MLKFYSIAAFPIQVISGERCMSVADCSNPAISSQYIACEHGQCKCHLLNGSLVLTNSKVKCGLVFRNFICRTAKYNCIGPNKQYKSFKECADFLLTIPLGDFTSANSAQSNTISCRAIHAKLAIMDPNVHCQHISMSGGCVCA